MRAKIGILAPLGLCLALASLPAAGKAPRLLVPEGGIDQAAGPKTAPAQSLPPAAEPKIVVQPLPPADPGSFGLAVQAQSALSFAGSDPERLAILLARLSYPMPAETVRGRVIDLLAAPWPEARGGTPLLLARARALAALGAGKQAAELALLAALDATEWEARLLAAEGLARDGAPERACSLLKPLPAELPAVVALAFACTLLNGERSRAGLLLELAKERGVNLPSAFLALAAAALAGEPLMLDAVLDETRAAQLLLFARLPLRLAEPPPASLSPLLLRVLAANERLAPAIRLDVAERSAVAGLLALAELRALMQSLAPATMPNARPQDARERAALVRAIFAEAVPAARAALLQRAVTVVPAGVERVRWLELLAPAATALAVDAALLWAVDGILPPLLAAGEWRRAAEWSELARRRGQDETLGRAVGGAAILAGLAPMAKAGEAPPAQRALLFALAHALGREVPEAAWTSLVRDERSGLPRPPPSVSLWWIAQEALAAGRSGEAVLAALALLGPAPEAASPQALALSVSILRQAGEVDLARALAVAIALALRL